MTRTKKRLMRLIAAVLAAAMAFSGAYSIGYIFGEDSVVTVTVTDEEGNMLDIDAEAVFTDASGTEISVEIKNGTGTSEELADGETYTVSVSDVTGYEAAEEEITVEGGSVITIALTALDTETITGCITYEDGTAASDITVTLSGYTESSTATDEEGAYSFEIYSGQDYEISVEVPEGYEEISAISVSDDADYDITLVLKTFTATVTYTAGGSVIVTDSEGNNTDTLDYGEEYTVTVSCDAYYEISAFTVNETLVEGSSYTGTATEDISVVVEFSFIADTGYPEIDASQDITGWTNSSVTISGTVSDDRGLESFYYTLDGEDIDIDTEEGGSFSVTFSDEMEETIVFTAADTSGNITTASFDVKIDLSAAEVMKMTFSDAIFRKSATYSSDDITLTVLAEDEMSGISYYTLYKDGEEYAISEDGIFTLAAEDFSDELWPVCVTVTDMAGNTSEKIYPTETETNAVSDCVQINSEGADIDITVSEESSNTSITVVITIADDISGLYSAAIYLNGEVIDEISYDDMAGKDTITVTIDEEEGYNTLSVTAVNNAGVASSASETVLLDFTAPEIKSFVISKNTALQNAINFLTFGTFFNNDITITVTASDELSNVSCITLYADGEELGIIETDSEAVFTIDDDYFNAAICATATDSLGNTGDMIYITEDNSNAKSSGLMIEKNAPVIDITYEDTNSGWYTEDVTFTITASDADSGLDNVTAKINGTTLIDEDLASSYTTSASFTVDTADAAANDDCSYILTVTVTDNSGNTSTCTETVYIDTVVPYISYFEFDTEGSEPVSTKEYGYFFDDDTAVTVTALDDSPSSGIASITYYLLSYDGTKSAVVTKDADSDGKISFAVEADFKGWIYAKVTDVSGNTSDYYMSDGSIIESSSKHSEETHISFSVDSVKDYYSDDVDVTVTVTDTYSGIASVKWSVTGPYDSSADQSGTMSDLTVISADKNLTTEMAKTITVSNDSNDIVLSVTMTDNSGNTTTDTYTLNIDKTDPVITYSYDNNDSDDEYTGYYDAERTITVTVTDYNFDSSLVTASGISLSDWTAHTSSGTPYYTATYTFGEGDQAFSLYVADKAGNVSNKISDSFTIDLTAPKITVVYDNDSAQNGNYYKASRTATVTVTEVNFDPDRVTIEDGSISSWTSSGDTHTATVSFTSDGTYTFDIAVTDKAGNIYDSYKAETFVIDKTSPAISISYDNNDVSNGTYYLQQRTATITVTEANFDASGVSLSGTYGTLGTWNSSGDVNTLKIIFSDDGDYSFTLSVTDKAGNTTAYGKTEEFTIDRTDPVMSVSFDGSSSIADISNTDHTVTVTITEHNFDPSGFSASISAEGSAAPSVSSWTGSGDTHTATIYFSDEGTFSFVLYYTDLAGNDAQVYTSTEFIIDLTAPEITISGVEDQTAYRSDVEPVVICTDENYNETGITITLGGFYHDSVVLSGAVSETSNGQSITLDDIEHDEDADDVYTLTVTAEDLAGNSSTTCVTFSINRYGSTFILTNASSDFVEEYYHQEAEEITVIEINVDALEETSVAISNDGNITYPEEDNGYTLSCDSEVQDGSGWYQYTYTFSASEFEEEGVYDITISTTDSAGNSQDNKKKDCRISFAIDKTSPSAVITGIEAGGIYDQTERSFTVKTSDNIALASLTIYTDDDVVAVYTADELEEIGYSAEYTLTENADWQTVRVAAVDAAGNEYTTDEVSVLISTNFFNRFVKSDMFLWVLIVFIVIIAALVFILLRHKKRKKKG